MTGLTGARLALFVAAMQILGACASQATTGEIDDRPYVLVTNDDGYSSDGIKAVALALSSFADVVVVAPLLNQSGASQSTHVFRKPYEIRVREAHIADTLESYSITGSPADSVYAGVLLFGKVRPFDLVVSGINAGPNYGEAYYHSGTVGAAFQAASQGIPAIAASQANRRPEYSTAAEFIAELAQELLQRPLPQGVIVSVNVPDGEIPGAVVARPGRGPYVLQLNPGQDESGDPVYWPKVIVDPDLPATHDVEYFRSGYITVTPLQLDRTNEASLSRLKQFDVIAGSSN